MIPGGGLLDPLVGPGGVALNQLAFSVLFAVVFLRDIGDHPENRMRVASNVVALAGTVVLFAHGLFQPGGAAVMVAAGLLFVGSFVLHLVSKSGGVRRLRRAA